MKLAKKVFIIVLIILSIPLIIALFVPSSYSVERSVNIHKEKDEVFNYVKFLKNQSNYSKWGNMDPNMKKTYEGEDGTVGFISKWESKDENVGVGEQEIKEIVEGEKIVFELRFKEPFESTEKAWMTTESISENETKIVWGFYGSMDYPSNLMLLFVDLEEIVGNDFQEGLGNLKVLLEQQIMEEEINQEAAEDSIMSTENQME